MALSFASASSERVSLGSAISIGQNVSGLSACAWILPSTVGAGGIVAAAVNAGGSTSRMQIELVSGDYLYVARRLDADGSTVVQGGAPAVDVLAHVVGVAKFTGGGIDLYIDGVFIGTTANAGWTANSANTTSGNAHIGSEDDGAGNYFNGTIDDVRIYHRALSANEINTIYRARGRDNILEGLHCRWTFSELVAGSSASGSGVVRDKGPGQLHGTPTNTPTYASSIAAHRRRKAA